MATFRHATLSPNLNVKGLDSPPSMWYRQIGLLVEMKVLTSHEPLDLPYLANLYGPDLKVIDLKGLSIARILIRIFLVYSTDYGRRNNENYP